MKEKKQVIPLEEKIKLLPEKDKWYLAGYIDRALIENKSMIKNQSIRPA